MSHSAVVTFTARPLAWILNDQGSRDWRLDPRRTAACEYLVCTQNRHNEDFGAPAAPHGAAFLIARRLSVLPSPERPDRWIIQFQEYSVPENPIPNIWGKSGHHRYPVHYTTLEALGIDPDRLPPFRLVAQQPHPGQAVGTARDLESTRPGLAEAPLRMAPVWSSQQNTAAPSSPDTLARLDAILAQLDRIPDLPRAADPLAWDEHGLPR